jgi:hypothetical protein
MTREPVISTPDPRFDPSRPIIVNGYRFAPATMLEPAEFAQTETARELVHGGSFALGMVVGFCLAVLLWGGGLWAGGFYG